VGREKLAIAASKLPFPFVNLYGGEQMQGLPQVGTDDIAIGRMAGEHLLSQGFRNLGFLGLGSGGVSTRRLIGFQQAADKRNIKVINGPVYFPADAGDPASPLNAWLLDLPKPIGIFAVCDPIAATTIRASSLMGFNIPEQIAILGVGNDELMCEESVPPLSSIQTPDEEVGYHAAQILDKLLTRAAKDRRSGKKPKDFCSKAIKPIYLAPVGVKIRKSTDIIATEDIVVAKALKFIRETIGKPTYVDDVAGAVAVSRRRLDERFHIAIGRTVFKEIQRIQIEHAKELLRDTNLTIDAIAVLSGLNNRIKLTRTLKQVMGISPGAYRKQFRLFTPAATR